jgi:hypothetical protein
MHNYMVTGPFITIGAGELQLTPEQAEAREYALKPLNKNLFQVIKPVGFKRGESFGYRGPELSKAVAVLEVDKKGPKVPKVPAIPPLYTVSTVVPLQADGKEVETPVDGEPLTVQGLAERLNLTLEGAITLLADYEITVKGAGDIVPVETLADVLADFEEADTETDLEKAPK